MMFIRDAKNSNAEDREDSSLRLKISVDFIGSSYKLNRLPSVFDRYRFGELIKWQINRPTFR